MTMITSFIASEDRLDLCFYGDLDLTITEEVCQLFAVIPSTLRTCIMDLTGLERVFDSGIAMLWLLNERLKLIGATVVILSDRPEILQRIPRIMGNVLSVVPQDSAAASQAR